VCSKFSKPSINVLVIKFHQGEEREGVEWVVREGVGAGGRNDPSLVCTYK
jgi:hypothetical protein